METMVIASLTLTELQKVTEGLKKVNILHLSHASYWDYGRDVAVFSLIVVYIPAQPAMTENKPS